MSFCCPRLLKEETMKEKEFIYNDDFSITADEFLAKIEALEKNKIIQQSLLNKDNVLTFPKNVSLQAMEARL